MSFVYKCNCAWFNSSNNHSFMFIEHLLCVNHCFITKTWECLNQINDSTVKNKPRGVPILSSFLYPRFTFMLLNWPLALWDLINPLILKSQWDVCVTGYLLGWLGVHPQCFIRYLIFRILLHPQLREQGALIFQRQDTLAVAGLNFFSHSRLKGIMIPISLWTTILTKLTSLNPLG